MKNGKTYKGKLCNPEQLLPLFSVPQTLGPVDCESLEGINPLDGPCSAPVPNKAGAR